VNMSRESKRLNKSCSDRLNSAVFVFPVFPGSAEAQVRSKKYSGLNLVQNLGGYQCKAWRAELRAEASKPTGARESGVLGEGDVPLPTSICAKNIRIRSHVSKL